MDAINRHFQKEKIKCIEMYGKILNFIVIIGIQRKTIRKYNFIHKMKLEWNILTMQIRIFIHF